MFTQSFKPSERIKKTKNKDKKYSIAVLRLKENGTSQGLLFLL